MNKRDLIADLKICNKATSGPWLIADEPEVIIENTFSSPILFSAVAFEDDLGASKFEALKTEDLDFILQAREGWPHAIERAIEAEALAWELVAALQGVSGMLDYATGECRCGVCEYCNVQKRADKTLAKAKEVLGDA